MISIWIRAKSWFRRFGKPIRRVYIEQGCMICNACATICPEVFYLSPEKNAEGGWESAIVKDGAGKYYASKRKEIHDAAEGCCVAVIKIEYSDGSRSKFGEEAPHSCCSSK